MNDDADESPDLEIHVDASGRPTVVTVAGEIDAHTATALEAQLDEISSLGVPFVLDVTGVGFIDSSGLRVLIQAHTRAGETGATLTLRGPSETLLRLLEITGLEAVFPIEPPDPA